MDKVKQYQENLDKKLSPYPIFNKLEAKVGVPKSILVGGAVSIFIIMAMFNFAGSFITSIVGWVYPAYASFKAIESKEKEDDKQWLTYWTVMGFINLIEFFSDILLFWIPFYYLFKTALLLWLSLPYFRGAQVVYNSYLRTFLLKYTATIDHYITHSENLVQDIKNQ